MQPAAASHLASLRSLRQQLDAASDAAVASEARANELDAERTAAMAAVRALEEAKAQLEGEVAVLQQSLAEQRRGHCSTAEALSGLRLSRVKGRMRIDSRAYSWY